MKNKYLLGLAIFGFFGGYSVSADPVGIARSGVDLYQSNMTIEYTKYSLDDHTHFECFGEALSLSVDGKVTISKNFREILASFGNDSIGGELISFDGSTDNNFIELNIDDPSNPSMRNCFQQAGEYNINITLSDAVGNTNSNSFSFLIKATNPDQSNSLISNTGGCDNVYANNSDECELQVLVRDKFRNNVLELEGKNISVYDGRATAVDPWGGDDANLGLPFFQGVRIYGGVLVENPYLYLTNAFNSIGYSVSESRSVLRFSSLTPSLKTNANDWQDVTTRNYPISVMTYEIDPDGSPGEPNSILLSLLAPLRFLPPIQLTPKITVGVGQNSDTFESIANINRANGDPDCGDPLATSSTICPAWNAGQSVQINVIQKIFSSLTGLSGRITGAFQRFIYPGNLYKVQYSHNYVDPNPPNSTMTQQIFSGNSSHPSPGLLFFSADGNRNNPADQSLQPVGEADSGGIEATDSNLNYQYIWNFSTPSGDEWLDVGTAEKALEIKTQTSYTLNSKNISYFAGKHQLDNSNDALDILIEGFVFGTTEKVASIPSLIRISGADTKNIRTTITSNAFKLSRGANTTKTQDYQFNLSDFNFEDIVVVKNANVTIGSDPNSTTVLPSGKKTLIIIDGNLNINSNIDYRDLKDSFGFILVNTKLSIDSEDSDTYPLKGNIYVHSDVMNIVGSYFSDGGIMTSSAIPGAFRTVTHSSSKQLILTGSLATKNTIGGASAPDAENKYMTPWGKIENNSDIEKSIAKRYDLRNIRLFSSNGGDGHSDTNLNPNEDGHPFILRSDRKLINTPPPGFETQEIIR